MLPKWLKVILQILSYIATLLLGANSEAIANTLF